MSQLDLLFRLQQIDDEINQKKQRYGETLRLLKGDKALETARQNAETAAAELQKWQSQQRSLNLELKGMEDKSKRSVDRLYSGLVKNPKELSDLQSEIDSLQRRQSDLEDELLETMIMFEEAQEANEAATAELNQIETEWNDLQADLKEEQNNIVQRINELTQARKDHVQHIPDKFMSAYDHVTKRGQGQAVAELKNNRCRACQVSVPANLVRSVDQGQLAYCDNCGRILCPA